MRESKSAQRKLVILLLCMIIIGFFLFQGYLRSNQIILNETHIFTFWEPKDRIPRYLQLCMNTWRMYLPDYQVIVLDYSNLHLFLDRRLIAQIVCPEIWLPLQAEAIRVAILHRYGGIWLDTDTIIFNSSFLNMVRETDLAMIGNPQRQTQQIAFIYAHKRSIILRQWFQEIKQNARAFKHLEWYHRHFAREATGTAALHISYPWNYLGNGIVDRLLMDQPTSKYLRISKDVIRSYPEQIFERTGNDCTEKYRRFYFQPGDPNPVLDTSTGIILLHNSWTPESYKHMNVTAFLKQNILLASILESLLFHRNKQTI